MKKILFATTALVATAGVAAADVSIAGRAAFGVQSTNGNAVLRNYFDLYFSGTTETDGGVALSATVEMEGLGNTSGAAGTTGYGKSDDVVATTVFSASAGGLTFTYGNTDGAFDKSMTEVHRIAGIGYELWSGASFIDHDDDGMIARIDYSVGDFSVALSYAGHDESVGIGAKYSTDMGSAKLTLGAAYESQKAVAAVAATANLTTGAVSPGQSAQGASDYWGVSARADFGAFSIGAGYADSDNGAQFNETWNISAQYSANGLTVGANYLDSATANSDGFTVFGTYDLGGGASLFAQYGERANGTTEIGSLGVAFSF